MFMKKRKANVQSIPISVQRLHWRKHRIYICFMLASSCLRVLIGHRVPIISVFEWHRSYWILVSKFIRVQKDIRGMLFINRKVTLIAFWNALGFFAGPRKAFPLLVDLSNFYRSFYVERKNHSQNWIRSRCSAHQWSAKCHGKNNGFEIMTTICFGINFRVQNFLNCSFRRIIRRVLSSIVVVHHFMQREKLFIFDKDWALNYQQRQVVVGIFTNSYVRW